MLTVRCKKGVVVSSHPGYWLSKFQEELRERGRDGEVIGFQVFKTELSSQGWNLVSTNVLEHNDDYDREHTFRKD